MLTVCHLAHLVDCAEGHDEDGHQEVGQREAEDQVVGHGLELPVQQDRHHHEHVPCSRKSIHFLGSNCVNNRAFY